MQSLPPIIGAICGNLTGIRGVKLVWYLRIMEGPQDGEGFVAGNRSKASSLSQRRLARERRREQQHMQDGHEMRVDSDE